MIRGTLFKAPPFITPQWWAALGQRTWLPSVARYTLEMQDMGHAHSLDAVALTQANTLAGLGDLAHAHSLDTFALTQQNVLAGLGDLTHVHTLDSPAVTVAFTLAGLGDLLHAHSFDTFALTQQNVLDPLDVFHFHSMKGEVIVYTDDFNRANEDIEDNSNWIPAVGWDDPPVTEGNIVSNTLRVDIDGPPGGVVNAQWAHDPTSADCYIKLTITQHIVDDGQTVFLGLRGQGFDPYTGTYLEIVNPQYWIVLAYVDGLASGQMLYENQTIQDGDEVEFRLIGNTFIVLVNGIELIPDPDNVFNDPDSLFEIVNDRYVLPHPYCPTEPGFVDIHGVASVSNDGWIFDDFETGNVGDNLALTQQNTLAGVGDLMHAHRLDAAGNLIQQFTLTMTDLLHAHSLDAAGNLTQANLLAGVGDLTHAHSLDSFALTQQNTLAGLGDLSHTHSLDAVVLTQAHLLTMQELLHAHTFDTFGLTQQNTIAVADLLHAHSLDAVVLTDSVILTMNDMGQPHSLDTFALTQQNILAVAELMHVHSIDAVVLTQQHVLTPAGLMHLHSLDGIALLPGVTLAVADVLHIHRLDGDVGVNTLEVVWHVLTVAGRTAENRFVPSVERNAAGAFTVTIGMNDFAARN